MSVRSVGLVLLGVLLCSGGVPIPRARATGSFGPCEQAAPESFDALRRAGFEAFYNLDYEEARKCFERLDADFPEHPAGPLYLATHAWIEWLNRTRRLQAGLYINPAFYAQSEERVSEQEQRRFRAHIERAIERAEARLRANEDDVEARYFLGAAYAVLAGYEATVLRKFFSALRNGFRAVKEHREVLRRDPEFADAKLTVGLYEYVVGSLPLAVKILVALGGIRGSRERGIQLLEEAAQSGRYVADDARTLLIAVYYREGRFSDARRALEELIARYPRNYLFGVERANLLMRIGERADAVRAFEELLAHPAYREMQDLIRYQYAEALFQSGYAQAALHHFRRLLAMEGAHADLQTLAHLRVGQILDLRGERRAAQAQYRLVLQRENVLDAHEQARRYLRRPYAESPR
jgi:tetratricopeptide (TPR) repeat protein